MTASNKVAIGTASFNRNYLENSRFADGQRHALDKDPHNLQAHLALGVVADYQDQWLEAIDHYWEVYRKDPEDLFIRQRLHDLLTKMDSVIWAGCPAPGGGIGDRGSECN